MRKGIPTTTSAPEQIDKDGIGWMELVEVGGLGNGNGLWATKGNVSINRKLYRFPVAVRSKAPTGWPVSGLPAAEKTWQEMRAFRGATVRAKPPDGRVLGEEYNLLNCPVTSGPNIFLSTTISNTLSQYFSIDVND